MREAFELGLGRADFSAYLGIPHVPRAGELAILCAGIMGALERDAELREVAERCNQRRHDVQSVERRLRKAAAVNWIGDDIGKEFDAIVTGVNRRGTFVRLADKHVEGKVVSGAREGIGPASRPSRSRRR